MKSYKSKKERREEEHERRKISSSPLLPAVYMLGIIGIILSVGDLLGISMQYYFLVFGATTVLTALFWYLYNYQSKAFIYVTAVLTIGAGIIMIPQTYSVTSRLKYLISHNYPISGLSLDMIFILTVLVLLTFFLFCLEFVMRSHSLMFALGIVLIILVPIFGHEMSIFNIILLSVFETGFAVINMTDRRSLKNVMKIKKRSRINVLSMILVLVIFAVAFLPAFIIERSNETNLFNLAYRTDNLIKEGISRLMGDAISGDLNSGSINRGNLYQSGAEQLSVTVDKIPTSTFYIKGFVGKDYDDSNWSSAYVLSNRNTGDNVPTEPFMESVFDYAVDRYMHLTSEPLPYPYYYLHSDLSDPISELHYMLAENTRLNEKYFKEIEIDGTHYLQVQNDEEKNGYFLNDNSTSIVIGSLSNATQKTAFVPYYAKHSPNRSVTMSDYSFKAYPNSFLSGADIKQSSDLVEPNLFKLIEEEYESCIESQYIRYPEKTFKRLLDICNETPLEDLNSITTYILVTLQNHAVYTTTPGNTPYNKDVIDYFLFENGKGYCVHFASAAVLMYRMYGIPARYVTGYVAHPTDFRYNRFNRGFFTANLTDKSAHAWVEIYLKDYGWVPVEVTPGTDGLMHAEYPGYNENVMRFLMSRNGWKFNGDNKTSAADNGDDEGGIGAAESSPVFITVMTILPFAAVLFIVIFLLIRRRRIIRSIPAMSCQQLFDFMIRALHYSKLLPDMNGSEKDFPQKLSECIEQLSPESCERLIDILLRANYSNCEVSPDDRDYAERCLRTVSAELYRRTGFFKKLSFKFIHAFPT